MTAKKNGLNNFLQKVVAAREKTNYKIEVLAVESDRKFSSTSADLNGLTLDKFIDNYHTELDTWIRIQTKPAEGSFRAKKEIKYGNFQIFDTVKYNVNRGYFQFGEDLFKIHWVRHGSPAIKGIALNMENVNWIIRYGSDEDETLSPVPCILPSVIHALYKSTSINRRRVFDFQREVLEYVSNSIQSTLNALINSQQATMSERFQFDDAAFVITVTSLYIGRKSRTDLYMTVTKDTEYENLLSYENVKQLAESVSKSNDESKSPPASVHSDKFLNITRADFIRGCNAALLESAHAQNKNPLSYYDKFILDNNAVEEFDSEDGHTIYFKLGEKNIRLGCFERENSLAAIFCSSEMNSNGDKELESDLILMLSAVRSFYKNVDLKKIFNHLQEMLTVAKKIYSYHCDEILNKMEEEVISNRIQEKTSFKEFQFENEIFFVKVTTVYDCVNKSIKNIWSFTMTRDSTLKKIFDKTSENIISNEDLGITHEEFLNNYKAFINEQATDKENNPFKVINEYIDGLGESYLQLKEENCRIYLTVGEKNLKRVTYRSIDVSGWQKIFSALSFAIIKGRLSKVEDFSKFFQETSDVVAKEFNEASEELKQEISANAPTEPFEKELFKKTFPISGLAFEFVFHVLIDPTSRKNPLMFGFELTIEKLN